MTQNITVFTINLSSTSLHIFSFLRIVCRRYHMITEDYQRFLKIPFPEIFFKIIKVYIISYTKLPSEKKKMVEN